MCDAANAITKVGFVMASEREIISEIIASLGLTESCWRFDKDWENAENSARVEVLVMGEFNHGKSSLINMLVGAPVLRVGLTPTTQVETTIGFGAENDSVTVFRKDGSSYSVDLAELQRDSMEACDRVCIELSNDQLPRETLLIDTPGLNEAHALRETFVETLLERASLVLFVLDALQPATRHELEHIENFLTHVNADKCAILVNKCDKLDEDEFEEVRKYVETTLPSAFTSSQLYFVSARKADYPGNTSLFERIRAVVEDRREIVTKEAIARVVEIWKDRLLAFLWLYRAFAAQNNLEHAEALIVDSADNTRLEQRLVQATDMFDELMRTTTEALGQFENAFQKAIIREIDKASIDDVEDYLEGFVLEEYRSWMNERRVAIASTASQCMLNILNFLAPQRHIALRQGFSAAFQAPHMDKLIRNDFAEKAYVVDIFDEIQLERLVKLPGVYKYRVDVARQKAKKLIHDAFVKADEALQHDITLYKNIFKRICSIETDDMRQITQCLIALASGGNDFDITRLENAVDQMEKTEE